MPDTPKATDGADANDGPDAHDGPDDDKKELRASFQQALARKAAKNSHVEKHLDGHTVGGGNNDTHKRQFRRKSG